MSDSNEIAIKVSEVSKSFKLPHEKNSSVKSIFVNPFKKRTYEKQEVLKDISFEIRKGEFFGIVGRNGSGKSTLLKLMSGIYSSDKGHIQINGKLTPFIELGVGFNPELTGRENVFLNGALLGFNRKEMLEMYQEIVAFAEIERFMDQKLKNYSSGMQVRLAFSIAIRAQSDILVLDEVLAVGDEAFQRKCFDYFERIKAKKQTVVLVTHDMKTVEQFCSRALMLHDGVIKTIGNPSNVATKYTEENQAQIKRQGHVRLTPVVNKSNIKIELQKSKQPTTSFNIGDTMQVVASWTDSGVSNVGVSIHKQSGERMYSTNTFKTNLQKNIKKDKGCLYEVELHLAPGTYYVRVRLLGLSPHETIELVNDGPIFDIFAKDVGDRVEGLVRLPHKWISNDKK